MALILSGIKFALDADESSLGSLAARTLGITPDAIRKLTVKRISLDARKKRDIHLLYTLRLELSPRDEAALVKRGIAGLETAPPKRQCEPLIGAERPNGRIVVAGLGPAGLFAAYELARFGFRPLVIERGRPVKERAGDVGRFFAGGPLDPESNVLFGEGGAGTFSDGKLTTRIKDERADEVVELLARFGAPDEIRQMAKPHIGTDRLRGAILAMRRETERLGGEILFSSRVADIHGKDGALAALSVAGLGATERIASAACILATGQAAEDVYGMLAQRGVALAPKAFAAGVRIEHPRALIDQAQFGAFAGHPRLGAAEYHLTGAHAGRGVYTFCMCPGGSVIAATSAEGRVVVNGMSDYARDGVNSNSAIVVQITPEDMGGDALSGLRFRRDLERAAFDAGGGAFHAPAERVGDFLKRSAAPGAFGAVKPTYAPGVRVADLRACLPGFMADAIAAGIGEFAHKLSGFDMADAVLTAIESRTSAPVRILRDEQGEAVGMQRLYPAGEGAGYAGGIVSAAVDGMRAAERVMARFAPE